jgi:D-galactarolactone cycloisomerase
MGEDNWMKITDVRAMVLAADLEEPMMDSRLYIPGRKAVIAQVETDEGITGMGESMFVGGPPEVTKFLIEREIKEYLLDENPLRVEWLWEKFYQGTMQHGRKGALIAAYSGVDVALWDIAGQKLGQPVYMLMGGFRDKMRAYASAGFYRESKDLGYLVDEVRKFVSEGFTAIKIKIGRQDIDSDMKRVEVVREAIGDSVDLMVDANNAYSVHDAVRVARRLEAFNITFLEEPLPPENIDGYARLVSKVNVPIASGELEHTRYGFRDLIANRAVDIVQPDVAWSGGLTECKKIADLASAWQIPCAPHAFSSAFCLLSNMHLVGASPNCWGPVGGNRNWYLERYESRTGLDGLIELDMNPNPLRTEIVDNPIRIDESGAVTIPDKPGLGLEVNQEVLERFKVSGS